MTTLSTRKIPARAFALLTAADVHPLLARLYAARGVSSRAELDLSLKALLPPATLTGASEAAILLADAIEAGARMVIVADYDCDGATACAVGVRALRAFGADVRYVVPDRVKFGYGLTPPVVELAAAHEAEVLITVDNGIASIEGIAHANALGMTTVVTDHHLPGATLPAADVIVNPNQPGCGFPSKALAGVGVMFYVMLALRAELRRRSAFAAGKEPNLASLLDLVALGTVTDVVPLDHNNRILVSQGLKRMRDGHLQAGVRALFAVAGRESARASIFDLGFATGPRLNAAGRLADMSLGIECLITDDPGRALNLAQELERLNRERRAIETDMQESALFHLDDTLQGDAAAQAAITLFDPDWHQGVVGLVASRIKEKFHRPTIAFARGQDGELKGSGRSIPGLHLRDALDLLTRGHPDLIVRFGGHAMAAGLSLREENLDRFRAAFEDTVARLLAPADRARRIDTDGSLETGYVSLEIAHLLDREVWGQNFPPPLFEDVFQVERQRILKDRHLKLELSRGGARFEAIRFNHAESAPDTIRAAYRLGINEYKGVSSVQLMVEHFEPG
ncbi:single-stranded-DNA-specific exonuclease [Betaproteobacteria bacterium]|nr:single-stranded-DNA-specific exonuclease [Betaproteobacteria bacterium]GHT98318.1 single-stranded-DNA-specific exonuclease [Betaproteobacteria bacterium]GHU16713.1 single-stranded-DNA-specific exonuclease [Betaproteobacteria bacterium]